MGPPNASWLRFLGRYVVAGYTVSYLSPPRSLWPRPVDIVHRIVLYGTGQLGKDRNHNHNRPIISNASKKVELCFVCLNTKN